MLCAPMVFVDFSAQAAAVREVEQAGERNQQNHRPQHRPARTLAQVAGKIQKTGRAERREHQWQQIGGDSQQQKRTPRQIRAGQLDPVVRGMIGLRGQERNVIAVERPLRHEQQQRHRQQRDTDDVAKTVMRVGRLA